MNDDPRRAWVSIPTEQDLRARMLPGERHHYDFGFLPAMGALLRAHSTIGEAFVSLYRVVMFGHGQLDRGEREMIAAVAAAAQDCHY